MEFDVEQWDDFTKDLWALLGMRVKGNAMIVLDHTFTKYSDPTDACLLPYIVWWELERDAQGHLPEHRLELQRAVARPDRARSWNEVPSLIRAWETKEGDLRMLTGVTLDDTTRIHALLDILPLDLGKQARSQATWIRATLHSGHMSFVR